MKKLYSGFDLCAPTTRVSMTINGPAPMILAMFMNTAIDQQVEKYLQADPDALGRRAQQDRRRSSKASRARVRRRAARRQRRPRPGPARHHRRPAGRRRDLRPHPRRRRCQHRARHRAGRHPQGRPGAEHLHLQHRVRAADDGRHPAVLRRPQGAQLLLGVDLRLPHRRSRGEPDQPARLHPEQRLHHRRVLPGARHEDGRLRAQPVVLLQQRHGPGIHRDRPRRPPHLGARDARALRRRPAQPDDEVPHPDQRPLPARAGDPVQRHPHHAAGAVRAVRQLQHRCTPTPTTKRSPRRPRKACAARWRSR